MKGNFKPEKMKKSLKITFATALCAVFAFALTFCGSKPAETSETVDTVSTETVAPAPADTTATEVAADTTAAE